MLCEGFFPEFRVSSAAVMANERKTEKTPTKGSDGGKGPPKAGKNTFQMDVEREVAKRMAASEKERLGKAKLIAAEIQRRAVLSAGGVQDGGPSKQVGTQSNETPDLLRNMCGILNKGFANLGSDMKSLKTSLDSQMNSLSDSLESNFQELWCFENDVDAWLDDGGSEAEPGPPTPFQFRAEHELSDDETGLNVPTGDENNGEDLAGDLGIVHINPCETENFFARFSRSLRVPTDVGEDLDSNLA